MSKLRFGNFALDLSRRQLLEGDWPLKLGMRAFDMLRVLPR
jgi:DNA-binding winged helix-turn-helix (wHTH) protein